MPHHVVQRGVDRQAVFFDAGCRWHYLRKLREAATEREVDIHAWCLMTNHIHLLITPRVSGAMSLMMQDVNRAYVQSVNTRFERTGHLWAGRFYASLVDKRSYFFCCMRYIEFNPVRAGLVSSPDAYTWSSWHSNAGGAHSSLITPHAEYLALGDTPKVRQARYRCEIAGEEDAGLVEQLRSATRQNTTFGSDAFISEQQELLGRSLATKPRGRPIKGV